MFGAGSSAISNIEIWYGVSDGSNANVAIECNCVDPGDMRLGVSEWSGLVTPNTLDVGADGYGDVSMAPATVGPLTTTHSRDLLVFTVSGFGNIDTGVTGAGTWTSLARSSAGATTMSIWYQLLSETGTFTPTVNVDTSWDTAIVALRAL